MALTNKTSCFNFFNFLFEMEETSEWIIRQTFFFVISFCASDGVALTHKSILYAIIYFVCVCVFKILEHCYSIFLSDVFDNPLEKNTTQGERQIWYSKMKAVHTYWTVASNAVHLKIIVMAQCALMPKAGLENNSNFLVLWSFDL